jgi:hypothetical protein
MSSNLIVPDTPGVNRRGDFFAVDRRCWGDACGQGLNAAVAYLVLARGTDRDNRTTAWSVHAIEKYTGLGRRNAQRAIDVLCNARLVQREGHTGLPKYVLRRWHELHPRRRLTRTQQTLYDSIEAGTNLSPREQARARDVVAMGWLFERPSGVFRVVDEWEEHERIWLPNALVTGAAKEVPPVERLRQTQDVMTLRLLIDLYYAQDLHEDLGISRDVVVEKYERKKICERGEYTIWGFAAKGLSRFFNEFHKRQLTTHESDGGAKSSDDFFGRFRCLVDLGLVELVPHLIESDSPDAEIIHAYGVGGTDEVEDRLGDAVRHVADSMLTDEQAERANQEGFSYFAPIKRHIRKIEMIGVARLRYRPHTSKTAAWWADINDAARRWIGHYDDIARRLDAIDAVA